MSVEDAFTTFPMLTTPRLTLRAPQPGDAPAYFEILSDREVMRYYGSEPHQSVEDTAGSIQRARDRYERRETLRWAITLRDDPRLIGTCGLFHFNWDSSHAEIGYELHRAFWGQGIMAEAATAILNFAFAELALHRIEADIDDDNARSKGLLLKLGFTYDGRLRERLLIGDRYVDEFWYSLLRHEWRG